LRVADNWVNHLIGDAQPCATKITKQAPAGSRADAPLRSAGLWDR